MIANIKTGAGFLGALKYILEKAGAEFILSNLISKDIKSMSREMREVALQRSGIKQCVHHVSLSAAEGERLTDKQWQDVVNDYMESMGFTDNQFIIVRHNDTDIDHIHVVINRIKFEQEVKKSKTGEAIKDPSGNEILQGIVVSDSNEHRRANKICEDIEIKHGLEKTNHSKKATPFNSSKISKTDKEMGFSETKSTLINRLDFVISDMLKSNENFTASSFAKACKAQGVDVHYNKQDKSIRGCSYSLTTGDSRKFSGTKLRRDLTFGNIRKTFNPTSIRGKFTPKFTSEQKTKLVNSMSNFGITGSSESYGAKFKVGNWSAVAFDSGSSVTIKGFPDPQMTAQLTIEAAKAKGWTAIHIDKSTSHVESELRKQAADAGIEIIDKGGFGTGTGTSKEDTKSKISIGDVLRGDESAEALRRQQELESNNNISKETSTSKSGGRK